MLPHVISIKQLIAPILFHFVCHKQVIYWDLSAYELYRTRPII